MDFPVWSYGYMLTPQVAIPVLFLATSLMKWNQFSERCYITGGHPYVPQVLCYPGSMFPVFPKRGNIEPG